MTAGDSFVSSMYIHHLMARAQRSISARVKRELTPFDITPVQFEILHCLSERGLKTPKEISSYLGVDNTLVSVNLDKLEKKGLILRKINTGDRRSIIIELTETSRNMNPHIKTAFKRAENQILGQLNRLDTERLCDLLTRINSPA